jgi:hypothetical protein
MVGLAYRLPLFFRLLLWTIDGGISVALVLSFLPPMVVNCVNLK